MEDTDIIEIAGLIHRRWADAFEVLKHVKAEKNDGSPDWEELHEVRFESAQAEEWEWNDRKQRYLAEHKSTFKKMWRG